MKKGVLSAAVLVCASVAVADQTTDYWFGWNGGFTCWWQMEGNLQDCESCCLSTSQVNLHGPMWTFGCIHGCNGIQSPPPAEP